MKTQKDLSKPNLIKPVNIVFEGGGVKCVSYVSTLLFLHLLNKLENKPNKPINFFSNLQRASGSSAGSIYAALLAFGVDPTKIYKFNHNISLSNYIAYNTKSKFIYRKNMICNSYYKIGFHQGLYIISLLRHLCKTKFNKPDITFAELEQIRLLEIENKKTTNLRQLYIVISKVIKTKNEIETIPEIASHETYPNLSIWRAVRASMAAAPYFAPIIIKSKNKYLPLKLQLKLKEQDKSSNDYFFNPYTLGIRNITKQQYNHLIKDNSISKNTINKPKYKNYFITSNFTMIKLAFNEVMVKAKSPIEFSPREQTRTIYAVMDGINSLDFHLLSEQEEYILNSGKKAAMKFLKKYLIERNIKFIEREYNKLIPRITNANQNTMLTEPLSKVARHDLFYCYNCHKKQIPCKIKEAAKLENEKNNNLTVVPANSNYRILSWCNIV